MVWVWLAGGALWGQSAESEVAIGYIRILTDTDLVQIYFDGEPIGLSPIREQFPVNPGWHTLSFFSPDFRWTHWTHRQRVVVADIIAAGTYQVLVEPGELQQVHMYWHNLEQQLLQIESGRRISSAIGLGMVALLLLLMAEAV